MRCRSTSVSVVDSFAVTLTIPVESCDGDPSPAWTIVMAAWLGITRVAMEELPLFLSATARHIPVLVKLGGAYVAENAALLPIPRAVQDRIRVWVWSSSNQGSRTRNSLISSWSWNVPSLLPFQSRGPRSAHLARMGWSRLRYLSCHRSLRIRRPRILTSPQVGSTLSAREEV